MYKPVVRATIVQAQQPRKPRTPVVCLYVCFFSVLSIVSDAFVHQYASIHAFSKLGRSSTSMRQLHMSTAERPVEDRAQRTRRIMESIQPVGQTGGAGGSSSYEGLLRLDEYWAALKEDRLGKQLVCPAVHA
jgi:hypothetical protein